MYLCPHLMEQYCAFRYRRFDNMVRLKTMKGGLTVDNVLKMSQSQVSLLTAL